MGSYARFEHYLTTLEMKACPEFFPPSPVSGSPRVAFGRGLRQWTTYYTHRASRGRELQQRLTVQAGLPPSPGATPRHAAGLGSIH